MRVCIAGSGLIGRAWGMIFARAGWSVRLWDPAEGAADAARELCAEGLRDMAAQGLCEDPGGAAGRIAAAASIVASCVGVAKPLIDRNARSLRSVVLATPTLTFSGSGTACSRHPSPAGANTLARPRTLSI